MVQFCKDLPSFGKLLPDFALLVCSCLIGIIRWHIKGGNGVNLKVKVKVSLICPLFSNTKGGWQRYRSCGVVRSIMSPSRGDDPGSNPGTSTKHVIGINSYLSPLIEVDKEELLIIPGDKQSHESQVTSYRIDISRFNTVWLHGK